MYLLFFNSQHLDHGCPSHCIGLLSAPPGPTLGPPAAVASGRAPAFFDVAKSVSTSKTRETSWTPGNVAHPNPVKSHHHGLGCMLHAQYVFFNMGPPATCSEFRSSPKEDTQTRPTSHLARCIRLRINPGARCVPNAGERSESIGAPQKMRKKNNKSC